MEDNKSFYEKELKREKVGKVEETNLTERKIKKYSLVALTVLVAGLNIYGINKYLKESKEPEFTSDYAYSFDIDETEWCEPIIVTRYYAPAGYILEGDKCYKIDENGEKIYVSPIIVQELSAPDGYVLIGDKCFKINETKEKGR